MREAPAAEGDKTALTPARRVRRHSSICVVCDRKTAIGGCGGRQICITCFADGSHGLSNIDMNYAMVSGILKGKGVLFELFVFVHVAYMTMLMLQVILQCSGERPTSHIASLGRGWGCDAIARVKVYQGSMHNIDMQGKLRHGDQQC